MVGHSPFAARVLIRLSGRMATIVVDREVVVAFDRGRLQCPLGGQRVTYAYGAWALERLPEERS